MQDEKKSNWVKYGAVFAILIMVSSAVLVGLFTLWDGSGSNTTTTTYPFADVSGTHANFTFSNIKDGVQYLPEGAVTVSSFTTNSTMNESLNKSFPGLESSRVLVASYSTGILEYYTAENENNAGIMIPGDKPVYDQYEGYNFISPGPSQRVLVGNPIVVATLSDYSDASNLAKKAVNVFTGLSQGSRNFDSILAYADDVSDYEQMTVSGASNGSSYSMLYQRSSAFSNSTIQLETVVYGPSAAMRSDIKEMAAKNVSDVTYSVTEDDSMIKLYIDSTAPTSYMTEANNLYGIISRYTNASSAA
ncbi:MAG: hypothetical protein LBU81_02105 [Methanosarcinales archaeon]|jgi:hypothetical protein|nr:hypothetical protein [Methanosarcinales archaeon]